MTYKEREITVIIPCYKAVKYLDNLYSQFSKQMFKNFKILLVNDGDKEQTDALNKLALNDSRFSVIWKENGGASSARNIGIDLVNTEWMVFMDADDQIKDTYLASLFKSVDGTNAEIGIGGFSEHWEYNNTIRECFVDIKDIETSVPWKIAYEKLSSRSILNYPWNKIYKTELVHKLKLYQDLNVKVIQDYVFNLKYLQHVKTVGLARDCGYIYRREDGISLVSCFDDNFEKDRLLVLTLEEELFVSLGKDKNTIDRIMNRKMMIFAYMQLCNLLKKRCPLTKKEKIERLCNYLYQSDINNVIKSYPEQELNGYFLPFRWLVKHANPVILLELFSIMASIRSFSHKRLFTNLFLDV